MERLALGIIETLGYIAAVEALDISLKSANVKLVNRNFVTGGLINITISGDVGAVKAAIDSVTGSMQNSSNLISTHVIPRPTDSVWKMMGRSAENYNTSEKDKSIIETPQCQADIEKNNEDSFEEINKEDGLLEEEKELDNEETKELTQEDEKKN